MGLLVLASVVDAEDGAFAPASAAGGESVGQDLVVYLFAAHVFFPFPSQAQKVKVFGDTWTLLTKGRDE